MLEAISPTTSPRLVDTEFRTHGGNWVKRPLKLFLPSELNPPLKPTLITDQYGLNWVSSFLKSTPEFCIDTETNRVEKFWQRKIRTIQVGNKDEQYVIDLLAFAGNTEALVASQGSKGSQVSSTSLQPVVGALRPFLETNQYLKVGTNLEFDYMVLRWCLGFRMWHLWDTQLVEKVRWTGQVGFFERDYWALDDQLKRYCGLVIDKSLQTSFDLETPLTQEQIEYAAFDVRGPLAVKTAQVKAVDADDLSRVVQIENNAIPAFGDLKINGFYLNTTKWRVQLDKTRERLRDAIARMDQFFIPVVGRKGVTEEMLARLQTLHDAWKAEQDRERRKKKREKHDTLKKEITAKRKLEAGCIGEANINYGSPLQLLAALRAMKYGAKKLPSTGDEDLEQLAGDPCIDAIRDYRTSEKILGCYGSDWLEAHTTTFDGRIHANFVQLGADTGRTSCSDPNLQQILKGQEWRSCFTAPPRRKIVTADWNGQELRVMTEFSGEDSWRDAFHKDQDVHSICAFDLDPEGWTAYAQAFCEFFTNDKHKCKCPGHEMERGRKKALNFGIPYGKTEFALAKDLKTTKENALQTLNKWYARYKKHHKWLTWASTRACTQGESRTLSGRRRLFPKFSWDEIALRLEKKLKRRPNSAEISKKLRSAQNGNAKQGKNSPIQGSGADMLKMAMGCGFDSNGKPFLWHILEPEYNALIVNEAHDEIVAEADEANADAVETEVLSAMERAGGELVKSIRMAAEAHVGNEWKK